MLKKILYVSVLAMSFLTMSSCSRIAEYCPDFYQSLTDFPYFSDTEVLTLQIETLKATNHGAPFYVLVKATDFAEFLMDDYQHIACSVVSPGEDPAVLASLCIIPGLTKTIKVKTLKGKSVGIYCLFTHPGEAWKHIIDAEEESRKLKIVLGDNEIKWVEMF